MTGRKKAIKYIFVTGGVVSSLGKGIASASLGKLLQSRGLRVNLLKFDPYINVDPGTMNPFQHGEIFVTDDGAETDLDLGHYERFLDQNMGRENNVTAGQIYEAVIARERRGGYLGKTVQVIPHVTDEIKSRIRQVGRGDVGVVIAEVGGTVGDIESLPFLEAIRQMGLEEKNNVLYLHLTLVPYILAAQEVKTKPTQHSVRQLREIGIQPDILLCRTRRGLTKMARDKIALFCNLSRQSVIQDRDVVSIYEVPLMLQHEKLDQLVVDLLNVNCSSPPDLEGWKAIVAKIKRPKRKVPIAICGKYVNLRDAYKSIAEALVHAGVENDVGVEVTWVDSEMVKSEGAEAHFKEAAGLLIPGGFGERGIEGKVEAVRYAREHRVPFLGICLGMQCALIELTRNVCKLAGANSTEFDPGTTHPVIDLLPEQKGIIDRGGTMRLGASCCRLAEGSLIHRAYGRREISERHRHRYEFNNDYRSRLALAGVRFGGLSPDGRLVESIELEGHPWFVAVQFHPELKSRPTRAHPLFREFVGAATEKQESA